MFTECLCIQDGSTALMFACENRNIEIVKRLLDVPGCNAGLEDNVSILPVCLSPT